MFYLRSYLLTYLLKALSLQCRVGHIVRHGAIISCMPISRHFRYGAEPLGHWLYSVSLLQTFAITLSNASVMIMLTMNSLSCLGRSSCPVRAAGLRICRCDYRSDVVGYKVTKPRFSFYRPGARVAYAGT